MENEIYYDVQFVGRKNTMLVQNTFEALDFNSDISIPIVVITIGEGTGNDGQKMTFNQEDLKALIKDLQNKLKIIQRG